MGTNLNDDLNSSSLLIRSLCSVSNELDLAVVAAGDASVWAKHGYADEKPCAEQIKRARAVANCPRGTRIAAAPVSTLP